MCCDNLGNISHWFFSMLLRKVFSGYSFRDTRENKEFQFVLWDKICIIGKILVSILPHDPIKHDTCEHTEGGGLDTSNVTHGLYHFSLYIYRIFDTVMQCFSTLPLYDMTILFQPMQWSLLSPFIKLYRCFWCAIWARNHGCKNTILPRILLNLPKPCWVTLWDPSGNGRSHT